MLRFFSIGSGSSGNCYLLYTDSDGLMIDCGVGVRTLKKYMHEYGLNFSQIHHMLVTHDHADHVKSVGSLSTEYRFPVYATAEVHQGIYRNWCVRKKVEASNRQTLVKGETIQIGEFLVTSFGVPHDSTDCVGYCIECEGTTFVIVTDCGHITDEIKTYISHANYLVIEANYDVEMLTKGPYPEHLKVRTASGMGHMSNLDCAKAIVENATPILHHVWLCHLSEENNHPELARKTIESVLAGYGLVCGKDFQLDVLKRKTPSGIFELSD